MTLYLNIPKLYLERTATSLNPKKGSEKLPEAALTGKHEGA